MQPKRQSTSGHLSVNYAVLALLLAVALLYQVQYSRIVLAPDTADLPFFATATASPKISLVGTQAAAAGLAPGDTLLAVNGRPYLGTAVLDEEVAKGWPGDTIVLTVNVLSVKQEGSRSGERTVPLVLTRRNAGGQASGFQYILRLGVPVVSLLLGFWVAFARPRDIQAWVLLALMLSFAQIFSSYNIAGTGRGIREPAMVYHSLLANAWPICMYFFGFYFPEPFPLGSRWRVIWKWIFWIAILPLALSYLAAAVVAVGEMSSYAAVAPIQSFLSGFHVYTQFLPFIAILTFFAAMFIKFSAEISVDSKRRLRLLYWGTAIALAPSLIVTVIPRLLGKLPSQIFPDPVIAGALLLMLLFPLTLAYVIVVERALDVHIAVREGLQYALAKGGIRTLQSVIGIGVMYVAVTLATGSAENRWRRFAILAFGLLIVLRLRQAGEKLRSWTDRRFFREAYDAEQVLTELSDQVRTFINTDSLISTVVSRISETLHVAQITVLLGRVGTYRANYAIGYSGTPDLEFGAETRTVQMLEKQKEPVWVYLDDPYSWLHEREATSQERDTLATLRSELLLPLAVRDKLLGFISLGPKRSEEAYSGTDVGLLKSLAAQTGLALENAHLMTAITEEVAQRERMNREVELAREVQQRLFPQKLPSVASLDYAGGCRPALGVGGDYYDFFALPDGQLGVAIGDVSGKGIGAALMMASLQASLRSEAMRARGDLAAVMTNVNSLVYEISSSNRYATFFYGQYNPRNRKLTYVNAGHNPPMHLRSSPAGWQVTRLEAGGMVIGLMEDSAYQESFIELQSGDLLVAFTDGVSEALNAADEEWDEERLLATIEAVAGSSSAEMIPQIMQAADAFAAGAPQHDDMTLVVFKVA
jgi:sigma-B regulation protein RsbU (phosphoserine phosphatase)